MYAEGSAVGKAEQRSNGAMTRKRSIRGTTTEFCGKPPVLRAAPKAHFLYEYIILLDVAGGECYGRAKSRALPNQNKGTSWPEN
jgi:hypothetical protein